MIHEIVGESFRRPLIATEVFHAANYAMINKDSCGCNLRGRAN